jgi:hypothetical protein
MKVDSTTEIFVEARGALRPPARARLPHQEGP